ncbi:MAG: Asp-tRNA(Asn)/Glu-tRNA(Gln) amidotransferase subunit GatA [Candidatus Diapherotrites archaeon]|nr:Asp-tRNA(Asn)/Glu-tRNA(Gln) amidotransferase subunit GatA [Candidatus Diapherotrites archaeon]
MRELVKELKSGELLPSEHLEEVIEKIEEREPRLNAFISLDVEGARERAKELDKLVRSGRASGLLFGLVLAVKDNIAVEGMRLTCASRMLENYVSPFSATAVERLVREGAIVIGKTNMDEFACGSSGETSYFGPTRNPWDEERVPGGSSSGSAVAVAAGMSDLSLGSDTGGSIRNPASFTGVFGFKPTYNLVSRYGLVDLAMSLDVIGPFSPDADGIALSMEVMAGPDGRDAGVQRSLSFLETFDAFDPEGVRVGWGEGFLEGVEEPVRRHFERFLNVLDSIGAELVELRVPPMEKVWPLYYLIMYPEFASAMQRYNGLTYGLRGEGSNLYEVIADARGKGFGREVKRRIILGTYLSMERYEKSFHERGVKLRRGLRAEVKKLFEEVDFLTSPTVPFLPFRLGERLDDPVKMYAADALTVLANLTGIPAINVPFGREGRLPVGMQLMGRWFEDDRLVAMARFLEGRG